jgi:hypothetical protein
VVRSARHVDAVGTLAARMRAAWLLTGAAAVPLLLSAALSAQTLPVPTLPPDAPSAAGPGSPDAGSAAAAGVGVPAETRPQPWEYGIGLGAGWDSNIDFLVPDGPSGTVLSPRANLARVFWGPHGELRVEGAGNWLGYPEQKSLSRFYADLRLEGNYHPSLNTTWRVNASYDLGYSDSSLVLGDQGVLLPLVKARTLAGALGVTRRLGTRTSLRLDGRVFRTEFAQEGSDIVGLVDGQSVRGTTGLERRLGSRDTVALEYALESALGRDLGDAAGGSRRYYLTHYGSLQWSHVLSPRDGFLLEVGASYTPDAAQAGLERRESFYGGASYSRRVGQSSVTLFARREVTPAFGLGVIRLDNRFGLSATIPMGRAWTLRVTGSHVMPETPAGAAGAYSTPDEAFVALGRRLGRHFEISGETRYRRRGASGTLPEIEGFQVGLFLSLLSPSGSPIPRPGR